MTSLSELAPSINADSDSNLAMSMHTFKSKLTVVAALSDVVSKAQNLTAEQAGRLKMIGDSARFVAEGLHDLIDNGRNEVEPAPGVTSVDICKLVSRAVREHEPLFEIKDQQLVVNYDCPANAICDYEAILEATRNLLSNASKHTQIGSRTNLSVGMQNGNVFIECVDNGPGIVQDDISRVVSFYGRSETNSRVEGNGIGMSVIHQAARSHSGSFTVASIPGSGSVFTIHFPIKR